MKRARWRAPACASGKVAYRSQGRALRALRAIAIGEAQAVARQQKRPVAAYKCVCGAWHLTSRQHA